MLNTHDSKLVSCVNSNNIKNRKAEQEHQDREMIMWSVNENISTTTTLTNFKGIMGDHDIMVPPSIGKIRPRKTNCCLYL